MESEVLKYSELIRRKVGALDCPYYFCEPSVRIGYRLARVNPNDPNDFLPSFIEDGIAGHPPRHIDPPIEENNCKGCGVSLFDTQVQARRMYDRYPRVFKKRGIISITRVSLDYHDGLSSESDRNGHFHFYEFIDSTFIESCITIERLEQ